MGLCSLFNKVCICYVVFFFFFSFSYKMWEDWRIALPGMLFVVVLRKINILSQICRISSTLLAKYSFINGGKMRKQKTATELAREFEL